MEPDARIVAGDPAAKLMVEADERRADLMCVGPDAGLVASPPRIGRVASRVLREAPCSVLIARSIGTDFPNGSCAESMAPRTRLTWRRSPGDRGRCAGGGSARSCDPGVPISDTRPDADRGPDEPGTRALDGRGNGARCSPSARCGQGTRRTQACKDDETRRQRSARGRPPRRERRSSDVARQRE